MGVQNDGISSIFEFLKNDTDVTHSQWIKAGYRFIKNQKFGVPKERPEFWRRLAGSHGVDPAGTLFADDSAAVLEAARVARVRAIYQVLRPDSTLPAREPLAGFTAIGGLGDLIP